MKGSHTSPGQFSLKIVSLQYEDCILRKAAAVQLPAIQLSTLSSANGTSLEAGSSPKSHGVDVTLSVASLSIRINNSLSDNQTRPRLLKLHLNFHPTVHRQSPQSSRRDDLPLSAVFNLTGPGLSLIRYLNHISHHTVPNLA